jgi:hypothetical protein
LCRHRRPSTRPATTSPSRPGGAHR